MRYARAATRLPIVRYYFDRYLRFNDPHWSPEAKLLTRLETLERAIQTGCSIARFGDGELALALLGRDLTFQSAHPALREALKEILTTPAAGVLVCLNNHFLASSEHRVIAGLARSPKSFDRVETAVRANDVGVLNRRGAQKSYRAFYRMIEKFSKHREFGDATLFFLGYYYEEYRRGLLKEIGDRFISLFAKRDVVIVAPEHPLFAPSFHSLLTDWLGKVTSSWAHIAVPAREAYLQYGQIKKDILVLKPKSVFIQAGPLATVLAHDLRSKYGITAYDVGSLNVAMSQVSTLSEYVNGGA